MVKRLIDMLPKGFPAFFVVGTIGFIVDAGVLSILVHGYGQGNYSSRMVSFAIAVTVTWLLNRTFSFADGRTHNRGTEYTRYIAVQGTGAAINFLVYSLCIISIPLVARWPVFGVAAGSAAAMIFNYLGMRLFVFTGKTT